MGISPLSCSLDKIWMEVVAGSRRCWVKPLCSLIGCLCSQQSKGYRAGQAGFDLLGGTRLVRNLLQNMARLLLSGLSIHRDSKETLHMCALAAQEEMLLHQEEMLSQGKVVLWFSSPGAPCVSTPCRAEWLSEHLCDTGQQV